jgi:hypothetical protein
MAWALINPVLSIDAGVWKASGGGRVLINWLIGLSKINNTVAQGGLYKVWIDTKVSCYRTTPKELPNTGYWALLPSGFSYFNKTFIVANLLDMICNLLLTTFGCEVITKSANIFPVHLT